MSYLPAGPQPQASAPGRPGWPPAPPPFRPPAQQQPGAGLATASMVLGILAVVLEWLGLITMAMAVLAVILGAVACSRGDTAAAGGRGRAVAGIILGTAGLAAWLFWGVVSLGALFII